MSFRLVATPLAAPLSMPGQGPGGLNPSVLDAIVPAAGIEPILERLRQPDVLAVTTGQQPALFTGPLYTVHKALSARALAQVLTERWKRDVVPLFWIAGDDHDFAEANHTAWLGADGVVRHASLRSRPADAPMLPVYREPLGPEITPIVAELRKTLPASPFATIALEWIGRHYQPAATIASSFSQALAELLAGLGIACIDSTHPALKRAAAPYLLSALEQAGAVETALAERAAALIAAGRDPGVPIGGGATPVMIEAAQGRDRLVVEGDAFVTRRSRERFSLDALRQVATGDPGRLSPNVLLRPVIERLLLPTVSYVAGPGELRYLPLAEPLYGLFSARLQLPLPRWSGIVVDSAVDRVLDKFGLVLDDLALPEATLESRLAREHLSREASGDLTALRAALESRYQALAGSAGAIDPTLVRAVAGRGKRALDDVDRLERRLVAHMKRRLAIEHRQLSAARAAVRPDGQPQERVFCAPSVLARHGPAVLDAILDAATTWYRTGLETAPGPA